jgi:predicted helicase
MSNPLINQYYQNLDRTLQFGKSHNEQSIRNHFWSLLNDYARKANYELIPEVAVMGTKGKKVYPDGTVKNLWGLDIGLWESKDEKDDIEAEIDAKIKKGYPLTNILFEDSSLAILYQRGQEVNRAKMRDADALHRLLSDFIAFRSETVYKFEDAIEKFKSDIPVIVLTLRDRILASREINSAFLDAQEIFLELCKAEINPDITLEDIREMMIQHILTSDIFNKIFDDSDFHRHNTIAAELEKLTDILFTYEERRNLLHSIEHYYEAINATAAGITDHHEKQKFLKVLYENFYKVYNPKAADRLGVVYTPNEIVQFMVQSTDHLLHKHFGKTLADKNVEILDPATGTGTFICEIIENAIPKHQLEYKFKNEIHANEVAILPYYIANLNIEYTFKQKMQYYAGFPNLCFVDTLDNTEALSRGGKQHDLFRISSENSERIKRQNNKKISVVIGNPPYNANQANFNDFNKNREYPIIDKGIKGSFVKNSTATNKANLYDMYIRFYRWAMDRIDLNGIICFITNNSFINNRAFDGFRKSIQEEYAYAYVIDMGGNIRELSGKDGIWLNEEHTIFGVSAAVGIAMMFLVKKMSSEKELCRINYVHPCDIRATRNEKIEWLKTYSFDKIAFDHIIPDKNSNWINLSDNDFESLTSLIDKDVKSGKNENAVFRTFSLGIASHRDEWVYEFSKEVLIKKISFFCDVYTNTVFNIDYPNKKTIAWDRELDNYRRRHIEKKLEKDKIRKAMFRPFVSKFHYFDRHFNGMFYQWGNLISKNQENCFISVNKENNTKGLFCLATNRIIDLHATGDSQCLPLYHFDEKGGRIINITDWGLSQFRERYEGDRDKVFSDERERVDFYTKSDAFKITKEDIFHYTYAVLHNPVYRKKYELNLKREFPRLPFYKNFRQWAAWGKALMDLHINYETVKPCALEQHNYEVKAEAKRQKEIFSKVEEPEEMFVRLPKVKVKLKADKAVGVIEIDELTFLTGVPPEAWEYKLGNRSALEWVLDQYKEKKPSDPTIAEKFNTYRFADYKTHVIDLLMRVCNVSVETMKIVKQMEKEEE